MAEAGQTLAGVVSAEIAGRVRSRARGVALLAVAGALAGTAWLGAVAGLVALLVPKLGAAGALFAVAGGLMLLALGVLLVVQLMGRAEQRAEQQTAATLAAVVGAAGLGGVAKRHPWGLLALGGLLAVLAVALAPHGQGQDQGQDQDQDG